VDYVNYISPVQGTKEVLQKEDPSVASNPLIIPDAATLANTQVFRGLTAAEETKYNAAFADLTAG
jgi:spermidine/putrescine transport system substrate-binding protein